MQAYYEMETQISSNHQLHIQLPDSIPAGRAKIAIIYELAEQQKPTKQSLMAEFLNNLPEPNEERTSWDN